MVRDDAMRIAEENTRLSRLLELETRAQFPTSQWRCAAVLSHGGATGDRTRLRIKGGYLNGIATNAVVAVPEGLVGRVVDVTPRTAIVQLLTSPTLRIACEIETNDPDVGRLQGILNGGGVHIVTSETAVPVLYLVNPYRLRHIKRGFEIPPRAKVITSGLGGLYPRGLRIGSLIDETREDETQLEREGDVEPAVDFTTLKEVFVRREN
ncbi:MAG: rod shape-determining protein MreC [Kiritimatiellia bacterium]